MLPRAVLGHARDDNRQNMVLSLAAFSGIGCTTSQCSTILPFSSRKMSTMADAALAGLADRMHVQDDQIAVGERALDLAPGVGELARAGTR